MDPAYGLQLHHPRFLEFDGAPESARLRTRSLSHWVVNLDRDNAVSAALQRQHDAGLMSSNLHVIGGDAPGIWRRVVSVGHRFAGAPGILCSPVHGFDRHVATTGWPG